MADEQTMSRERWWVVAKAVAYELRPFTLPTKDDLKSAAKAIRTNAEQLWAEAQRLAPKVVEVARNSNPLRVFQLFLWLSGWALFIWLEFGAVYFIVSAMVMIFSNLGERGDDEWSAYSVFNAGCSALLGTINAEQFEREIMRQNPAAPDVPNDDNDHQGDEFVWVDHPGMHRAAEAAAAADAAVAAAAAGGDAGDADDVDFDDSEPESDNEQDQEGQEGGAAENDDGGAAAAAARGDDEPAARAPGRKVSGKRARRGFEERKERQEERRLAQVMDAFGPDEWD